MNSIAVEEFHYFKINNEFITISDKILKLQTIKNWKKNLQNFFCFETIFPTVPDPFSHSSAKIKPKALLVTPTFQLNTIQSQKNSFEEISEM